MPTTTSNAPAKKVPGAKVTKGPKKKKDEEEAVDVAGGPDESPEGNKPEDQLELTAGELNEEITRILTAINPHAPHNIVRFNFKERSYKAISVVDQMAVLFELESSQLHQDSDEAHRLRVKHSLVKRSATIDTGAESDDVRMESSASSVEDIEAREEDRPDSGASKADKKEQKLTNQFNFSERASQTLNNPTRERICQTEPPPRNTFSATGNQWEIYDAYFQELLTQEKNKEKQKATQSKKDNDKSKKKMIQTEPQNGDFSKVTNASSVFERMINQNRLDDIAQDFKYFEDAADEFRDQEGTLLPLWRFQYDMARRLTVTALCWNNKYQDLFAVGMGSYDFSKQGQGMLLFYSLKNSAFPEYIYPTTCGVQCLDIHPQHTHLVAVGFYKGCVAVYSLKEKGQDPVYKSTAKTGKHTGPVWQVRWQNDDIEDNHNFFSVSSDSRVVCWTLVKNELFFIDIIRLSVNDAVSNGLDEGHLPIITGGTSMDFHKQIDYLFLVGTERGKIHKCSKTYSSQFLETYDAHRMAVSAVKWNHFHPKVFISCSFDWTIKIWDHTINTPMFTFDLRAAVGDVSWSPYSSTVFAAVTTDGMVHIFDLNVNKGEAICQQLVVDKKKTRLSHIEFNPVDPIIIVGDDRGYVNSLKLSPNLRKKPKSKKGHELLVGAEAEVDKMEKILILLREPEPSPV